jgi:hypothetical protein
VAAASKGKAKPDLVAAMNTLAMKLLAECDKPKVSLETQLATFGTVGRWIAISNKVADGDGEGVGLLDAYRSRIDEAQSEAAERESSRIKGINYERGPGYAPRPGASRLYLGRNQRAAKGGSDDNGGPELERLKSRLPGTDDVRADGDRGHRGGEITVDAGPARIVRPELPGNTDTRFDEPYSSDEF